MAAHMYQCGIRSKCPKYPYKIRTGTMFQAVQQIERMGNLDEDLLPFYCHYCNGWHIGHNE